MAPNFMPFHKSTATSCIPASLMTLTTVPGLEQAEENWLLYRRDEYTVDKRPHPKEYHVWSDDWRRV
ncbi:hypothetical protein BJ912DRAFT_1067099 [Pholiota molesta]|nr:hypothetical protein BJ912DRAFT_1067099 [Pholiota molesta]